jgi:chromosome segregation ATPase
VLQLRRQLINREQVIAQLNRRLLVLESDMVEADPDPEGNLIAEFQGRLERLDRELRKERQTRAESEEETSTMRLRLDELQARQRELEGLRSVRVSAFLRRMLGSLPRQAEP